MTPEQQHEFDTAKDLFNQAVKSTSSSVQTILVSMAVGRAKKAGIKPIDFIIKQVKEIIVS